MPWTELRPTVQKVGDAFLSCITRSKGKNLELRLSVRTQIEWFSPGKVVSVFVGNGDDAGRIRVVPGGPIVVKSGTPTAHRSNGSPHIFFPIPSGMKPGKRPSTPVRLTTAEGCLFVELPDWTTAMVGPHSIPQPAANVQGQEADAAEPEVAKQAKPGKPANAWNPPGAFKGLGTTTPLPLPARRA